MREYPKIQSIYKRDEQTRKFIVGDWSTPEIGVLADLLWHATEKIDGTNIRVEWTGSTVVLGGRTERANIPATLVARLMELFPAEKFVAAAMPPLTLYGEGYGRKIQGPGSLYKPDGTDFILFDVLVGDLWLRPGDVDDVASKLGTRVVPQMGEMTIHDAIHRTQQGFASAIGTTPAEGIVLTAPCGLLDRRGQRIVAKVKVRDWR